MIRLLRGGLAPVKSVGMAGEAMRRPVAEESFAGGPLDRILAAFATASSVDELAKVVNLPVALVRVGIDQLIRMGRIETTYLAMGCAGGSCGACSVTDSCHDSGGLVALRVRDPGVRVGETGRELIAA